MLALFLAGTLIWLVGALLATVSAAAVLMPLHGGGNFHVTCDVTNRWQDDGSLDVLFMVAAANRELSFTEQPNGRWTGRLLLTARLEGFDGTVVESEQTVRTEALDGVEVGSPTLFQVFSLVLRDVPCRAGRLTVRVEDLERKRSGLLNLINDANARSEVATDWAALADPQAEQGLTVAGLVFLAGAPVGLWQTGQARPDDPRASVLNDYLHPTRRYGLEQDHLQVYFELYPGHADPRADARDRLLVQISTRDPDYALRDTLTLDVVAQQSLAAGRPAGVFYELDVNVLPPGTFQLGVAPLSGRGRGSLREFDVLWHLAFLNRHADELMGEGRTVFRGEELKTFLAAGVADREVMLEKFWQSLDPDPETAVNEIYLEFRHRVAVVRERFGGFGAAGANDPRGEVFLLLGPPERLEIDTIPLNADGQDDAHIKVYERFAPDREGTMARGGDPAGTQGVDDPYNQVGGIPMPYSAMAQKEILARRTSTERTQAYELWRYDHAGEPLFPNKYSDKSMGVRFLFVDRTGTGVYRLESSNAFQIGD